MKYQNIRKTLLIISMLLFPVTIFYFSPVLIIHAGLQGIINGSLITFLLLFLLSVPLGRVFCSHLCPAGGLQECMSGINGKSVGMGRKKLIKQLVWLIWIVAVIACYALAGKGLTIDFFFETQNGISIISPETYIVYYIIILLIFILALLIGRRGFCHAVCWMSPFMSGGVRLGQLLHLPQLHIGVREKESCISCRKCDKVCPMSLPVNEMVINGEIDRSQCIQCGLCITGCPKKYWNAAFRAERISAYGKRKKDGLCYSEPVKPRRYDRL